MARDQLIADLGLITISVRLHDDVLNDGEEIILDALDTLIETEQMQLKMLPASIPLAGERGGVLF